MAHPILIYLQKVHVDLAFVIETANNLSVLIRKCIAMYNRYFMIYLEHLNNLLRHRKRN